MPWALRMITYAGIILVILLIYFGFRYFRSVKRLDVKSLWPYRFLFFIFAGLILAYPLAGQIQYWLHGTFNRTGYPDMLIYLYWYGVVCMGVMLNWLLLHDLLRPVAIRIFRKDRRNLKLIFGKAFLIIAGFTVLYTGVKMVYDTHRITVEEITFELPESTVLTGRSEAGNVLPRGIGYQGAGTGNSGQSGFLTIVHITDLHADMFTGKRKMNRYIRKVNDANPDIVVFTGDLITSGRDYIEAGAEALSGIRSTHGTYFVMGDHDYWVGTDEIARALEPRGIHVLQNENTFILHDEVVIKITGITELYSDTIDSLLLSELLSEEAGESLHLLASHQASDRVIRESLASGVHQLLAGHTHGGQIRVPLFFYPVTAARAESVYVKGNWLMGDMLLNINSGLGFTLSPVRYNAPAQVSVIKVKL